jgi:hypothetical protein
MCCFKVKSSGEDVKAQTPLLELAALSEKLFKQMMHFISENFSKEEDLLKHFNQQLSELLERVKFDLTASDEW